MTTMRVLYRTVNEVSEDPNAAFEIEMDLSPAIVPALPSYFTSTNSGGCEVGTWPQGSPPAGWLLVGGLVVRDLGGAGAGVIPIGKNQAPGSETCGQPDIAGTGWTFIDAITASSGGGQHTQLTFAYRDSVASEPEVIAWGGAGGLGGSAGPRSFQVALLGVSGAPTVTANRANGFTAATSFTSPNIAATGAGWICAVFSDRVRGPAEGNTAFTLTPSSPVHVEMQGYAAAGFGPYSWFGALHVASAGTYSITVTRPAAGQPNNYADGWILGFWPE